jgi:acyl-CoA reductase-like NAD-dependent aldehyde dehydrogenase
MDMLIGGTWQSAASGRTEDMTSPFDGATAGTVPVADVQAALDLAERGAVTEARGEASRSGDLIRLAGFEGDALVTDPRVRKVSFTGSTAIGQHITEVKTVILHGRPW